MKPKKGFCINCDNKHGCKSKTPPCIVAMEENNITGDSGKQYLIETGKTQKCESCDFFRSCWNTEEYGRSTG